MNPPLVERVSEDRRDELIDVLMLAFSTDPVGRYGYVTPSQYLNGMRMLFGAMAGPSIRAGGAWLTDGAGAIWLAPDEGPNEEELKGLDGHVDPGRAEVMTQLLGAMGASHPKEPHWYLNFIGVDPNRQGQGLGSAVLKASLVPVDEQGAVAYLESSNPKNVPLYERFGFEVTGEIRIGDAPVVYPMVRAARAS